MIMKPPSLALIDDVDGPNNGQRHKFLIKTKHFAVTTARDSIHKTADISLIERILLQVVAVAVLRG